MQRNDQGIPVLQGRGGVNVRIIRTHTSTLRLSEGDVAQIIANHPELWTAAKAAAGEHDLALRIFLAQLVEDGAFDLELDPASSTVAGDVVDVPGWTKEQPRQ